MDFRPLKDTQIKSERNLLLRTDINFKISLPSIMILTDGELQASSASLDVIASLIYFYLFLMGFGVIFGGLKSLWNTLDLFQELALFFYLNIDYPKNLEQFFDSFGIFNFSFFRFGNLFHFTDNEGYAPNKFL